MMQNKNQETSNSGVFGTLATGFDFTAKHLWLTLLPILMDTFLWIGPRLSVRPLLEQVALWWQQMEATAAIGEQLMQLAPYTNLFMSLSVPLVGVPALLAGVPMEQTPLVPALVELQSVLWATGLIAALSLAGLLLSSLYLTMIAWTLQRVDAETADSPFPVLQRVAAVWGRMLLLALIIGVVLVMIYIPIALVGGILTLFTPLLGMLAVMLGIFVSVWIILACFFTPHGLVLYGRTPTAALIDSIRLIRDQAPTPTLLILAVILIGGALDQMLLFLEDGSWFTFVSILAHAFVMTSLTAATFIYYRDRIAATQRVIV